MLTIQRVRIADCDRETTADGQFADDGYQYVLCEDNDINKDIEWFDTPAEAEQALREEGEN